MISVRLTEMYNCSLEETLHVVRLDDDAVYRVFFAWMTLQADTQRL